jgi:hypothetical protein
MRVVVRVRMSMPTRVPILGSDQTDTVFQARDDLDSTLLDPSHGQDAVRDGLQPIRPPAHHHDLETEIVCQVNVERGPDAFTELVLQLGELLAEIADVVVIDERQRADRVDAPRDLGPSDLAAREVAEQLGAGAAAFLHQLVELPEQGILDRDPEPDERILHVRRRYRG